MNEVRFVFPRGSPRSASEKQYNIFVRIERNNRPRSSRSCILYAVQLVASYAFEFRAENVKIYESVTRTDTHLARDKCISAHTECSKIARAINKKNRARTVFPCVKTIRPYTRARARCNPRTIRYSNHVDTTRVSLRQTVHSSRVAIGVRGIASAARVYVVQRRRIVVGITCAATQCDISVGTRCVACACAVRDDNNCGADGTVVRTCVRAETEDVPARGNVTVSCQRRRGREPSGAHPRKKKKHCRRVTRLW